MRTTQTPTIGVAALGAWLAVAATAVVASPVPFADDFEAYAPGTTFVPSTNGWGASTNTVQVQTAVYFPKPGGSQAVQLSPASTLSNAFAAAPSALWTDVQVVPVFGGATMASVPATASFVQHFAAAGCAVLLTTNGWDTCTNSVLGATIPVPALVSGAWVRVTVYQDFAASNNALFIDGRLLRQQVRFRPGATPYQAFQADAGVSNAYLDEFALNATYPATLTNDLNGNGLSEAQELVLYGRAAVVRDVAPGGTYTNLQHALAATVDRDIVQMTGGIYTGDATNLVANVTIRGGSFTNSGSLTVGAGDTVTVSGLGLTCTNLIVNSGGRVVVTNGSFTANGVTLTGSFTITDTWGQNQAQSTLPFADDFENYTNGTSLTALGFRGWGASTPAVAAQAAVTYAGSGRAVVLPTVAVLSNRVNSAGAGKVWTDLRLKAVTGLLTPNAPTNTSSFVCYVNGNGYLTVATPTGWQVCSNDAWGAAVNAIDTSTWARVTVMSLYSNSTSALFLDGRLLRQQLPFVAGSGTYGLLEASSGFGDSHLDNVAIQTALPSGLTNDVDQDSYADALEIDLYGTTTRLNPVRTLIMFR